MVKLRLKGLNVLGFDGKRIKYWRCPYFYWWKGVPPVKRFKALGAIWRRVWPIRRRRVKEKYWPGSYEKSVVYEALLQAGKQKEEQVGRFLERFDTLKPVEVKAVKNSEALISRMREAISRFVSGELPIEEYNFWKRRFLREGVLQRLVVKRLERDYEDLRQTRMQQSPLTIPEGRRIAERMEKIKDGRMAEKELSELVEELSKR